MHKPMSSAAQRAERELEERVRGLLTERCGVHEPHVVLVEQEPDRLVALFTVEGLRGRLARTAWIEPGTTDPEIVIAEGFLF